MEFLRPFAKTHSNISSTESEPVSKLIEERFQQDQSSQQSIEPNHQPAENYSSIDVNQSSVEQDISFLGGKLIVDDIDDIFKGYAKTIKKFSKKRQAITKFKFSQIIMQQELEHIEEEEQQHARNITTRPDTAQSSTLEAYVITPNASSSPSPLIIDQPSSNEQSYFLPIHCRNIKTETSNSYDS